MKKLAWVLMILVSAAYAETTPPAKHASAYVQIKGSPKKVRSMLEQLKQEDAYKASACEAVTDKKSGIATGISCAKPDSALMETLNQRTPVGMQWTMSVLGCPAGCTTMHCPPPLGPITCCKNNTPCP